MQRLEVSGAVRHIYGSLSVKRLMIIVAVQILYGFHTEICKVTRELATSWFRLSCRNIGVGNNSKKGKKEYQIFFMILGLDCQDV